MKNLIPFIFLLTILASGCSQEELMRTESTTSRGRTFTTSFEQNDSRTYIEYGLYSRWTQGDYISLFDGNTLNNQYVFSGETGDNGGTFFMLSKPEGIGTALSTNYAVYPYDEKVKITSDGIITTTLPAKQHYAENSYGLGDNTMVAITKDTEDTFLNFKNVGGCIKLQLYGKDVTIKSITLTGNNSEKIAGKATITATYNQAPIVTMADDATTFVSLDCDKGVKIGTSAKEATAFWMVLPPVTFEKGITVTVTDVDGKMFTQTTPKELTMVRNVVKPMAAVEVKPESVVIPYLTFTADDTQTLTMSKAVETLEYSVDNGEWKELGTNTIEFGGENGELRLRGKSLIGTATSFASYSKIIFGNQIYVGCYGDIRTLVDYENYQTVDTSNARFCYLFSNCSYLRSAPKLPATTLADLCYASMFRYCRALTEAPNLPAVKLAKNCYSRMFDGCTNLVFAPNLPATTLADYCYYAMFEGCTSLTVAPELPAMTMTASCYENMFQGCTSLTKAPKLPATTLAENCYCWMFQACFALTEAPELPATTMAKGCYSGMFYSCTSLAEAPALPATTLAENCYFIMFNCCDKLTKAPELPATTLAERCYWGMFRYCGNLNSITMLATDISATDCLTDWVIDVAPTGTFTKAAAMTSLPIGTNGIPEGWTVNEVGEHIDNTPYLTFFANSYQTLTMTHAVETLEYSVGNGEWKELGTHIVEFGAELGSLRLRGKNPKGTAGASDYSQIKFGNKIPVTSKGDIRTLLDYSNYQTVDTSNARFNYLFSDCSCLFSAPELPAMTLATHCYKFMFAGCTSLTKAPQLPATTLAEGCYSYMFAKCNNLTQAPELPATILAPNCYASMFSDCFELTQAPELPATTLAKNCYDYMFGYCTSLTQAPKLPATTLAAYCYSSMFHSCTSLTNAPYLPATTLEEGCYNAMFYNCSSLTQFNRGTSLTLFPELPATTLAEKCYSYMFSYCSSLTEAPMLPATHLVANCYYKMFYNCTNLNTVRMLARNHSATDCMYNWLKGVSPTGTFYKNNIMVSNQPLPRGDSGVPLGWTLKDHVTISNK